MNADIAAEIERARSAPPPPPPVLDRRFWRVRAIWDWDGDFDGIYDHEEFAAMADPEFSGAGGFGNPLSRGLEQQRCS
jgi:hypothetical protein